MKRIILDFVGHEPIEVWDIPEHLYQDIQVYHKERHGAFLSDYEEGREIWDKIKKYGTQVRDIPVVGAYA